MQKKAFSILILMGFLLTAVNSALASTVSLDPARIRISAGPGEVKSGTIKIDNPSEEEVKIRAYIEDWRYSSNADGTKDFFPAGSTALSCARWIDFTPAEFTLLPFGRQLINYTVRLPEEAKGVHFCVMFFETDLTDNNAENAQSQVNLKARLGALISVESKDSVLCDASLDNLAIKRQGNAVKISGDFQNIGNTDINPKITFDIINTKGDVFARGVFSDIFTLPQDKGEVFAATKEDLPDGKYILVITLSLGRARPKVLEVPIQVGTSDINFINS